MVLSLSIVIIYRAIYILATAKILYLPLERGVESVGVVFSRGGFFLGSSLSSWTWSLVASPEVVIKNTDTDHSTGLGILYFRPLCFPLYLLLWEVCS